jgi:hypothetical protein
MSKKTIGFIELPDEALDLFGHYAQQAEWDVAIVVSVDGQSYAARMADILKIPVLERPNRPALVACNRLIVGKKPGLMATIKELVEDTRIEIIPVEDALRSLKGGAVAATAAPMATPAPPAPAAPAAAPRETAPPPRPRPAPPAPAAKDMAAVKPRLKVVPGKTPVARPASPAPPVSPAPPAPPASAAPPAPPKGAPAPDGGFTSRSSFDAGTLLGADFRERLGALPIDADGDQLLQEILTIAVRATRADSGSIMLVDEAGTHLRIAVADGLPQWVIAHTRQEVGKGVAGKVFATRKPQIVRGQLPSHQGTSVDVRPDLREAACVPIPGKEGSIGVLNITVESEGTHLDEHSIALLNYFAREASGAILKAINLKRLSGRVQHEAVLRQVERLMSLQETLSSRLRSVGDVLGQNLGADFSHCLVVDASGKGMEICGAPKGMGQILPRLVPVETGFLGWVLHHESPCVLEAAGSDATDRAALAFLPLAGERPCALMVLERIPLDGTSAVEIRDFLTEVKEVVEALLAIEGQTGDLSSDSTVGPRPRRAR